MWRRLSRRTLAPRRPLLYADQLGLLLLTLIAVAAGVAVVVMALR